MLRICAIHAQKGMRLAMPIFHPERPATVLLKTGATLTPLTLGKLQELGIHHMWIAFPGLEEIADSASEEVTRARAQMTQTLADAFDASRDTTDPKLDYRPFHDAIVSLLDSLVHNPAAAQHVQDLNEAANPLLRTAANVAYISLLIGLKLDFYLEHQRPRLAPPQARDVTSLGLGALLHDVGALALDPEIREKYTETRNETDPQWREHVVKGFEMVRGKIDAAAATVVLHHHQHFDGSGYPARSTTTGIQTPAGTDIHILARIVAAVDLFESLQSKAQRTNTPLPTVRILRMLSNPPYSDWLDPVILLGLHAVIPPYAPGTIVELSNAARAVVTRWHPEEPCRPVVRQIRDLDDLDDPFVGGEIDLIEHTELEVVFAEDDNVQQDNFYTSDSLCFDLHGVARALINRATEDETKLRDSA
jgi:HD-GYP domain-containing protein (c-di-GMP phosphodiesterase class II)